MIKSPSYFQSRVNSGKMNEEFYKPIIEKDIKEQLKYNNTFNLFDFENFQFKIELKTREVERLKYKTTIVGYDKIEKGLEYIQEGKRVICYYLLILYHHHLIFIILGQLLIIGLSYLMG